MTNQPTVTTMCSADGCTSAADVHLEAGTITAAADWCLPHFWISSRYKGATGITPAGILALTGKRPDAVLPGTPSLSDVVSLLNRVDARAGDRLWLHAERDGSGEQMAVSAYIERAPVAPVDDFDAAVRELLALAEKRPKGWEDVIYIDPSDHWSGSPDARAAYDYATLAANLAPELARRWLLTWAEVGRLRARETALVERVGELEAMDENVQIGLWDVFDILTNYKDDNADLLTARNLIMSRIHITQAQAIEADRRRVIEMDETP